jgi:hypothetical protein
MMRIFPALINMSDVNSMLLSMFLCNCMGSEEFRFPSINSTNDQKEKKEKRNDALLCAALQI